MTTSSHHQSRGVSSDEAVNFTRLWAPWRSTFLFQRKRGRCIFCLAKRSRLDRQQHVIARDAHVFGLLNRYPYNNGHLMVAPYRHVGDLISLSLPEWHGILRMSRRLIARLRDTLRPHGFNVGLNLGRAAGAGIPGHLHVHIVPRWDGDTNFMPVLAHTKIVSQSLDELYTLLVTQRRKGR